MSTAEHRPVEYMRADAARNVQRIVEVAAGLLAEDPNVGMAEVAGAAGVGRATVYRHFATRDALLSAIYDETGAQAERALRTCRLDEGSASDAMLRLVETWLDIGLRFGLPQLTSQSGFVPSEELRQRRRDLLHEPIVALIVRGQRSGELSAHVSPQWAARAFGALLVAGARSVADGTLARADAPRAIHAMLMDGLRRP